MTRVSKLTDERLQALYEAEYFGAEKTMRARVIRELIDEIRSPVERPRQADLRPGV